MWVIKAKKNNKVYIHADKFADSKHAKMVGDTIFECEKIKEG